MSSLSEFPSERCDDWSHRFFSHPDYLAIYREMTGPQRTCQELDFCEMALGWRPGDSILDAPCGAGRHSAPMAQQGLRVTGLDLSPYLLKQARRREPWLQWRKDRVPKWVRGTLQCLPFHDGAFDFVACLFSSFGYMDTEEENLNVLKEYQRVLKPGGKALIDVMNRHFVTARLNRRFESLHGGLRVFEERRIIDQGRRLHNQIRVFDAGGDERRYLYRPWLYNGWELTYLATQAGMETDSVYGNFAGEMYHPQSERAMLVALKPR